MKSIKGIVTFVRIAVLLATLLSAFMNSNGFSMSSFLGPMATQKSSFMVKRPHEMTCSFGAIGGLADIKKELMNRVVIPLQNWNQFYQHDYLRPPPGIMFVGPPGTGKTMIAESIAAESSCSFIHVQLADIEAKYFGESSKLVRSLFETARQSQPCIIFMDEIDGIIRKRNESEQSCTYGLKTELLQNMDMQAKRKEAVMVIACTNCFSGLDAAVKRRLPVIFNINIPTREERRDIMRCIAHNDPRYNENMLLSIADACEGCTGSDLQTIYQLASNSRVTRTFSDASNREDVHANMDEISVNDWLSSINIFRRTRSTTIQ